MIGIYKITSPSGKVYIGSSINIEKRIRYYKYLNCEGQIKLYNSIKKHGWNNHILDILQECDECDLYKLERHYGDLYNVLSENGLNLILPKNGEIKKGVSDITKAKMSFSKMGNKNTFFGKKHTLETKAKISIAHTGRKLTIAHKKKVSLNSAKPNSKLVIDIENGIYYDSIKDAAFALGKIHSSLRSKVNGRSPTYTQIKIA